MIETYPADRELVKGLIQRDERSLDRYAELYRDRLYRVAVTFLGYNDPEAEDAVQDTFALSLKNIEKFEFRSSLYTWINHICVTQCLQRLRKRQRLILVLDAPDAGGLPEPSQDSGILEKIESEQLTGIIKNLILRLAERCQEILLLRDVEGHAYMSMARRLKIPVGTVMSRLSQCRAQLKPMLLEALSKGSRG